MQVNWAAAGDVGRVDLEVVCLAGVKGSQVQKWCIQHRQGETGEEEKISGCLYYCSEQRAGWLASGLFVR